MKKKTFNWGERIEASRVLSNGISVFDRSSFSHGEMPYLGVSYEPTVITVDRLIVQRGGSQIDLGKQNVLSFHGISSGNRWRQLSSGRDVEDILSEVEDEIDITALGICNPGGYKLPLVSGRHPYTYVCGSDLRLGIGYLFNGNEVVSNWTPKEGGRIYVKGIPYFEIEN